MAESFNNPLPEPNQNSKNVDETPFVEDNGVFNYLLKDILIPAEHKQDVIKVYKYAVQDGAVLKPNDPIVAFKLGETIGVSLIARTSYVRAPIGGILKILKCQDEVVTVGETIFNIEPLS